jgi:hypothetical protein
VVSLQALELARVLEELPGFLDALHRPVLDEGLGRFGDQRHAGVAAVGCAIHRHAAADAVAEHHEAPDAQLLPDGGKVVLGLAGDEAQGQLARVRVRLAEAEAIVGHHLPAGGRAQRRRKPPPQLDAAEGIVQQDDGRPAGGRRGRPDAGKETAAVAVDPGVLNRWMLVFVFMRAGGFPDEAGCRPGE